MADIMAWCESTIKGLRVYEYHEVATPNCDRDVAVAAWVVRCLANPDNADSQAILDAINERRDEVQNG